MKINYLNSLLLLVSLLASQVVLCSSPEISTKAEPRASIQADNFTTYHIGLAEDSLNVYENGLELLSTLKSSKRTASQLDITSKSTLMILNEEYELAKKEDAPEEDFLRNKINRLKKEIRINQKVLKKLNSLESKLSKKISKQNLKSKDYFKIQKEFEKLTSEPLVPKVLAKIETTEIVRSSIPSQIKIDDRDVISNPPDYTCAFDFQGIDPESQKERIDMKPEHFFGYTHPKLESLFKNADFLECKSHLKSFGGYYFLVLDIKIASKKANATYGSITQGNLLRLEMIDGSRLYLKSTKNSNGHIEALTGNTIYNAIYGLDKSHLKTLQKLEIDKVGIIWSTGFEEYEVFKVDFLMHQSNCILQ